ncbi:hypothetical protein [Streptomyces sp. NPDC003247]|uniref:hypothetical protein n=1 Tax=Streptomyces sp. NPDC003247 TaxID=3364677 RepID=UPI0036B38446
MRTVLRGNPPRTDETAGGRTAGETAGETRLECADSGGALLIRPTDRRDDLAVAFAAGLAADPRHTRVVVDLPARAPAEQWKAAARLLRRRGRSFRVVPGRQEGADALAAPQQLADLLRREVLAPDGPVRPAADGWLWVPEGHGSGWLSFRPGVVPRRVSRRFPEPAWEPGLRDTTWRPADGAVAEPLHAGVWLRTPGDDGPRAHRWRLTAELAARTDRLTVVLGSPGGPALPAEAVTGWWAALPPALRRTARFVAYGPVAVPGGDLGQGLADLLGGPVTLCAGIPEPARAGADARTHTVLADGTRGWRPFAREVEHTPRPSGGGPAAPPRIVAHRRPLPGLAEITEEVYRQTYRYAPGVVLEVVRSGLWLRPPHAPSDADRVRRAPLAPAHAVIWYDAGSAATADRLRQLARQVRDRLGTAAGQDCRVLPSYDAPGTPRAAPPAPAPRPGSPERPPQAELTELTELTDLAELIDLTGLTDLAAVRRCLAGNGPGGPPPDQPLARRIAAELRRLPCHRGPAVVRAAVPRAAMADWSRPHRLVTEWGFWPASTSLRQQGDGRPDADGSEAGPEVEVEFLVWSVTARPTQALDPGVPDRVVFLPGTAFRVLRVTDGPPARVLLREVPASEEVTEGEGPTARLDRAALAGLRQALTAPLTAHPAGHTA